MEIEGRSCNIVLTFGHDTFATILCLLQIYSSFQASCADSERGFSLMSRVKTKNRCRLDCYHLNQLMMTKSVLTIAKKSVDDKSDDESAAYQEPAIYKLGQSIQALEKHKNKKKLIEINVCGRASCFVVHRSF